MKTNTIETHKLVERIMSAGLSKDQSTAIVESVLETQQELVTKQDLQIAIADQTNKLIMVLIVLLGVVVAAIKLIPGAGA